MANGQITPSDDIKNLQEFYKDNVAYQRHHEDIRFKGSQLIVTLAVALIASLKFVSGNQIVNYAISLFIVLLGLLGLVQVIKHTERADRHALIARAIRARIGEVANANGGTSIEMIHSIAAKKHKEKAGLAYKLRARWFWMSMHLAITVVGLVIATLNYMKAL